MRVLSNEQLTNLALHTAGINSILVEAMLAPPAPEEETEVVGEEIDVTILVVREEEEQPDAPDAALPVPDAPACPDWDELEYRVKERERMMNRLCGRWTPDGSNRCDVEIVRRGDHLTLNHLKRNGCPHDERFVLLSYDGDSFIFYGHSDRVTSVSHDAATDTLMLSPGVDYTRIAEPEK